MAIQKTVDDIEITIDYLQENSLPVSDEEIKAYIARGHEQANAQTLTALKLGVDGEDVEISYYYEPVHFDRIRRITGYLVGTLDRFNDAKRAEESERVKHSVNH